MGMHSVSKLGSIRNERPSKFFEKFETGNESETTTKISNSDIRTTNEVLSQIGKAPYQTEMMETVVKKTIYTPIQLPYLWDTDDGKY